MGKKKKKFKKLKLLKKQQRQKLQQVSSPEAKEVQELKVAENSFRDLVKERESSREAGAQDFQYWRKDLRKFILTGGLLFLILIALILITKYTNLFKFLF